MGVPKFFRWAAERFPSIITPFKDSPPPVDNLYLDINGIIHNCTHPNDVDATRRSPTEKEMIQAMFVYLEKLFNAIQPRKYFLLAVDGVAPRAKMNQQRQRRYRAGYEMMIAREEALAMGEEVPEEKDVFDSNCITPGTPFMVRVSKEFQYFITMKLSTDPAWQGCQIIFSGHDCPGEGEHKIVDFIRRRKMQPNYDPNETHCMYGLDADLVMLALATHEPHFVLLREVVTFGPGSRKERERQEEDEAKGLVKDKAYHKADEFVLLHINVFRDYLQLEVKGYLAKAKSSVSIDFERVIDDFVFMCFFIGNDFLPTLPTIGINDGSIPALLHIYVDNMLSKSKYLTHKGEIDWRNAEVWLNEVGKLEFETLRRRQQEEAEFQKNRARRDPTHEVDTASVIPITSILEFKQRYYGEKHGFAGGWDANSEDMQRLREHYVEGLMWVMHYYYQGVPSWKWFFPHYYAPMASDMVNLPAIAARVSFELGKPFQPHQQLLAVLPPMSYLSMPKAYWPLLRSPSSPLAKYLPEHIVIDREGARAPWEGIVLIPFIDERTLLAAYESVQKNVSPEDAANNVNGPPLRFCYDGKMPPYDLEDEMFGSLRNVLVRRETYAFPHIDKFIPQLCPGVHVGTRQLEGFSTLQSKRDLIQPVFEAGVVSIFGRPTKNDSLILQMRDFFKAKSVDQVATLVGKEVLVGFPHYKRARIASLKDVHKSITASYSKEGTFSGTEEHKNNREESTAFVKEADTHARFMKSQLGLAVEQVEVLVYVHRFNGMQVTRKGHIERHFATTWTCYPIQLICTLDNIDMQEDSRYVERDRSEGDSAFGARCVYIGPQPKSKKSQMDVYGSCGTVVTAGQHDTTTQQGDQMTVRLKVFQEPLRLPAELLQFAAQRNWTALPQVAISLDILPHTLTSICSSIVTSPQFGSRELGLCLKFTGRCIAKVGYAKLVQHSLNPWYVGNKDIFARMEKDTEDIGYHLEMGEKGDFTGNSSSNRGGSGTWYFSRDAQELIRDYVKRFRPLIQYIEAGGVNSNSVEPQQFLTGKWRDRDVDDVLTEIETFLIESGLRETPMITATEEAFPQQLLEQLEASLQEQQNRSFKELSLRQVSRNQLYFPVTRSSCGHLVPLPLPQEQTFYLGSRVANCRATGIVPFGTQGTIVRLLASGREAEVVYDTPFTGGTRLDGRLKDTRAAITKLSALLVLKSTDAPQPQLQPQTQPDMRAAAAATTNGSAKLRELEFLLQANGIHVDPSGKSTVSPPSLPAAFQSPTSAAARAAPADSGASHSSTAGAGASVVPRPRSAAATEQTPAPATLGKRATPASATAHLSSTSSVTPITRETHSSPASLKITAAPGSSGISLQDLAKHLPASTSQRSPATVASPAGHAPASGAVAATTAAALSGITIPAPKSAQQHQHPMQPASPPATTAVASPSQSNESNETSPGSNTRRKSRDLHVIPDDFVSGRFKIKYTNTGSLFRSWLDTFTAEAVRKTLAELEAEGNANPL
ncbi:XRN1 / 5'-3' exoribonuclease A [Leishmania donovani]|uniref:5'-3' exoribonuclease 2 n=1 Tax=Leishmania donovani TaxID=5661 RepID=A0A3S5H5P0_LEIDO|nr:5'-3' exoribonuclease A, putative [Leishmania donovani]CAJ1986123.1 XRN1 / 5'-3' exoribonuclease A [Leishmania donovani]VDZ42023.1 5'-3'_exoribonuclease_A [Leishmania donovani]